MTLLNHNVPIETLREIAELRPMEYLLKFEDIMIHNLRMSLQKANRERHRTDGDYTFTADVINEVETKEDLKGLWLVMDIIAIKKKLKN